MAPVRQYPCHKISMGAGGRRPHFCRPDDGGAFWRRNGPRLCLLLPGERFAKPASRRPRSGTDRNSRAVPFWSADHAKSDVPQRFLKPVLIRVPRQRPPEQFHCRGVQFDGDSGRSFTDNQLRAAARLLERSFALPYSECFANVLARDRRESPFLGAKTNYSAGRNVNDVESPEGGRKHESRPGPMGRSRC